MISLQCIHHLSISSLLNRSEQHSKLQTRMCWKQKHLFKCSYCALLAKNIVKRKRNKKIWAHNKLIHLKKSLSPKGTSSGAKVLDLNYKSCIRERWINQRKNESLLDYRLTFWNTYERRYVKNLLFNRLCSRRNLYAWNICMSSCMLTELSAKFEPRYIFLFSDLFCSIALMNELLMLAARIIEGNFQVLGIYYDSQGCSSINV